MGMETTYLCSLYDQMFINVISDAESLRWSDVQWIQLYQHVAKLSGIIDTDCYLNAAAMMVMVGLRDERLAKVNLQQKMSEVKCDLGCTLVEDPAVPAVSDTLSGTFRYGTLWHHHPDHRLELSCEDPEFSKREYPCRSVRFGLGDGCVSDRHGRKNPGREIGGSDQ